MSSCSPRQAADGDAAARRRNARLLLLGVTMAWLATRGLVLWLFYGTHSWVTGDLGYFERSLAALPDPGLAATLVEYPVPGVVVVAFPWLVVQVLGVPETYVDAVLVLSVAADAAFMVLLGRCAGERRRAALTVWVLAVPLLGATAYARFDLVPGLLAGAALLLVVSRPRAAGAAGAVAAGLKLWPALVLPAIAAPRATRTRVAATAVVVGATLAGISLALVGWSRTVSPLAWQVERGLQIESVAATPAMVAWALSPAAYEISYSDHNAYEVTGPGTSGLLVASLVCGLALLAGLVALWLAAFRRGARLTTQTVVWLSLVAVAGFMVTSKVLSPQYLLWLLPLAAAAAALVDSRALRSWTVVLLATTGATQLVFPVLYGHLTTHDGTSGWAVLALVVRNALLVWLTVRAASLAVGGVRRAGHVAGEAGAGVSGGGRSSASRPGRRGRRPEASGG